MRYAIHVQISDVREVFSTHVLRYPFFPKHLVGYIRTIVMLNTTENFFFWK